MVKKHFWRKENKCWCICISVLHKLILYHLQDQNFRHFPNTLITIKRSSYWRCSLRKGVLRNFAKFTGKHLCSSLWHRCFPANFAKFLRTPFLQNPSGRLLLDKAFFKSTFTLQIFCFARFFLMTILKGNCYSMS